MSKRFGRNQKRKMRQQMDILENALKVSNVEKACLQYKLENAQSLALRRIMEQSGMYKAATERMAYALGRSLGDEIRPHAEKLLNSRSQLNFSMRERDFANAEVTVLTAEIPHLRIQYVVHP